MPSDMPRLTWYVVLAPVRPGAVQDLRLLARAFDEAESATETRLQCPTYQVVRRFAKHSNAEGFCRNLVSLGLDAFLVDDDQIAESLALPMATGSPRDNGFTLRGFDDVPIDVDFGDIIAVTAAIIPRSDDTTSLLIDLQRRSSPVTPRLDAMIFGFGAALDDPGADAQKFLAFVRAMSDLEPDYHFTRVIDRIEPAARKGLASLPRSIPPPDDAMRSASYDTRTLKLFGIYGFFARHHRLSREISGRISDVVRRVPPM